MLIHKEIKSLECCGVFHLSLSERERDTRTLRNFEMSAGFYTFVFNTYMYIILSHMYALCFIR